MRELRKQGERKVCTDKSRSMPPATYVYDPGPSLSQTTAKVNVDLLDAGAVLHYVLEQHLRRKEGRKEGRKRGFTCVLCGGKC